MKTDKVVRNLSLLAARLALGGSLAAHGAQKQFGAFEGPGMEGVAAMMESFGFRPGEQFAQALAATELTSGTLIALGALGPIGPAMLVAVMVAAVELVHRPKGYFQTKGGYELNTMYVMLALLLATHGYGKYSVDGLLGIHERTGPTLGWLMLAGGVAAAIGMLGQRVPQVQSEPQRAATTETGETETPATVS
jgi:putative oxidoreductase